jgi:uncharacterized protein (DUF58 family)
MKRRLTKRAFIVALVSGLLFIAGSTAQASWLFVIAAGVLGLVVGSLFIRHNLAAASIERSAPRRVRVGDEVRVGVVVTNSGRRALPLLRLGDHHGAFEDFAILVERLNPGQSAHVELVKRAVRRGAFSGGEAVLVSGAPFGFLRSTRTIDVPTDVTVVPRWVELRSFPILEPSSYLSDAVHERARTGAGEEFLGVRDYRPGDPPRFVHWRSTARAGHLVVREFEEEVASRVSLVLAGADTGSPPDSAYETLVSAAASIGVYALATGHPVDLVRSAPGGELEHMGDPDRFALLDWLARARPVDASLEPLVGRALERMGRRGTVVVLAPNTGSAGSSLHAAVRRGQAAGCRVIVVGATASSWLADNESGSIRETDLSSLAEHRASVRTVARGEDLSRCLGP